MSDKVIRFVHLTDLHIVHSGHANPGVKTDTAATLREVRRLLDAMEPRPSFIAVSGDLTNHGDAESFVTLREMMEDIDVPVLYALGNHDSRPGFYQGMLGRQDDLDATYDHEAEIDGLHVITLDSTTPGRIGGSLEDSQFAFLEQALARNPDMPKLLMVHHAPALDRDPAGEWESLSIADSDRLAETIAGHDVVGILCGHIHQDRVAHWHGVPVVVGMGQHCALDPLYAGDGVRSVQGTSFALGVLRQSGLTITFAPLPSDRRELGVTSMAQLRAYEEALAASLNRADAA